MILPKQEESQKAILSLNRNQDLNQNQNPKLKEDLIENQSHLQNLLIKQFINFSVNPLSFDFLLIIFDSLSFFLWLLIVVYVNFPSNNKMKNILFYY